LARLSEADEEYRIALGEAYLIGDASYWWPLIPDEQKPTTYAGFESQVESPVSSSRYENPS